MKNKRTGKKEKKNTLLIVLGLVCLISVVVMIVSLAAGNIGDNKSEFVPPPFEKAAETGMPDVDDESWSKIYQEGMSFTAYVCGEVKLNEMKADMFFTNIAENKVWLKLRVIDENGDIIAQTGVIKPGEYVKTVEFSKAPAKGSAVTLKIMSYEVDTYKSMGTVSLSTHIV